MFFAYDYSSPQKFQFVEELPWLPQLGINYILAVDGISLPMLILNGFVIFTGALMSWNIENRTREYWILLLLLAAGVYGVFVSLDLFLFFVFYELAVLPMYLLIGIWGSTRKEYGAMKLTLYLMGGSAFIILGMVAVYFGSGLQTFDMRQLAQVGAVLAQLPDRVSSRRCSWASRCWRACSRSTPGRPPAMWPRRRPYRCCTPAC